MQEHLHDLKQKLSEVVESASIRGSGAASFVYAKNGGRAIEASVNAGKWWIEFWEADDTQTPLPFEMNS